MEAVKITQREIEIRLDDEDEKLLKEHWVLEQSCNEAERVITIRIVPRFRPEKAVPS